MDNSNDYIFDPTYGYTLTELLKVRGPKEPKYFDEFWQQRYQSALTVNPDPEINVIHEDKFGWRVFSIRYTSTDNLFIRGWLLVPTSGEVKRGFIIGHGYAGRTEPDYHLPFKDAALLFPCSRGLSLSAYNSIPSDSACHVLHNIEHKDDYILGGCVDDVWLAVSALLTLFPTIVGHVGYLGISFSGGVGALALACESRVDKGHLNIPTFGHLPLRLRLASNGSAHSIQNYYKSHKKSVLKVLAYFDAATAAKRIKIPMHCACALFDPCVSSPSQFSIYNSLPCEKHLFVLEAGHHSYNNQLQQEHELTNQLNVFFESLS